MVTAPLRPCNLLRLRMMFKIPAVPSASYLAEGEVITSTRAIDSAGSCRKASVELRPTSPEGFPLIKIRTSSFPRKETLPSTSTETEGTLSSTSLTVPPLTVKSFPTLYIFLSNLISTVVRSAMILTASKSSTSNPIAIVPKFVSASIFLLRTRSVLNEINSTEIS